MAEVINSRSGFLQNSNPFSLTEAGDQHGALES